MSRTSRSLLTISLSVLLALATLFGLFSLIKIDNALVQQSTTDQVLDSLEITFDDTLSSINSLNGRFEGQCHDEVLLAMRQALFHSQLIKDIGYFQNNYLLCTTGIGVFDQPFANTQPTLATPLFEAWIKQDLILFNRSYPALILKNQSFNAVVRLEDISRELPDQFDWDISLGDKQKYSILEGDQDNGVDRRAGFLSHYSSVCSERYPLCVNSYLSPGQFFLLHHSSLLLIFVLSLLSAVFLYIFTNKWINRYLSLSSRIVRGFKKGCFYASLQPIVDLKTGKIVGCEALARYQDSNGQLFPDQFLPVIKQRSMTWQFTDYMIRDTEARLASIAELPSGFRVSLNLFPQDVNGETVNRIIDNNYFSKLDVRPILEIIEDEELHHSGARKLFQQLSEANYLIAIDDFGTGYSSLSQLKKTKCHILKMDRSFVTDMEEGSIRSSLVPHIVNIARELDAMVVAEGIENRAQQLALADEGIEYGQGWAFGKPMNEQQLAKLIQQQD